MIIREFGDDDARGWLECRLLSFLDTAYFDDVKTEPTVFEGSAIRLVADVDGVVAALIDVELDGDTATIDTIAVHPSHQRDGLATALLRAAIERLPDEVATIDAWTRDDTGANAWYAAQGFSVRHRYLHVYKQWDEPDDGWTSPAGLSAPVIAFAHAPIELEAQMRARFRRVHICRQYVRPLR